jgi:hypothetical protein
VTHFLGFRDHYSGDPWWRLVCFGVKHTRKNAAAAAAAAPPLLLLQPSSQRHKNTPFNTPYRHKLIKHMR